MNEPTNAELMSAILSYSEQQKQYQEGSVGWRKRHDENHAGIEARLMSLEKRLEQGKGAVTLLMSLGKLMAVVALVSTAIGAAIKTLKDMMQ